MSTTAGGITAPFPPDTPGQLTSKPIPTPTHGAGGAGSFSVGCSTTVAAAPLICLDVVLNSSLYPEWNRFCRKCTIDSHPKAKAKEKELQKQQQQQQQQQQAEEEEEGDPSSSPTTATAQSQSRSVLPDLGPGYLKLGTKFTFDVHMDPDDGKDGPGRATELEVSVLEPIDEVVPVPISSSRSPSPDGNNNDTNNNNTNKKKYTRRTGWRVAWKTRTSPILPGWMLRSERVQEFVTLDAAPFGPRDEPQTAYACWETFYGVLAPVVRLSVGSQLVRGFNVWMEDMKKRAEELEGTEGAFAPVS